MTSIWNSGKTNKASCKACSTALIILFSTAHHVTLLFTTSLFSFNIFTRNQCRAGTCSLLSCEFGCQLLLRQRGPGGRGEPGADTPSGWRSNLARACWSQGPSLSQSAPSEVGHRYGAGDVCWRSTWPPFCWAGPASAASSFPLFCLENRVPKAHLTAGTIFFN